MCSTDKANQVVVFNTRGEAVLLCILYVCLSTQENRKTRLYSIASCQGRTEGGLFENLKFKASKPFNQVLGR